MNQYVKIITIALRETKQSRQWKLLMPILLCIIFVTNISILINCITQSLWLDGIDLTVQAILRWLNFLCIGILICFFGCFIAMFFMNGQEKKLQIRLLNALGYCKREITLYITTGWFFSCFCALFMNHIFVVFIGYVIMSQLGITAWNVQLLILLQTIGSSTGLMLVCSILFFLLQYFMICNV